MMLIITILFTALINVGTATPTAEPNVLLQGKGLIFISEGGFLLSGDKWTIVMDIKLSHYRSGTLTLLKELVNLDNASDRLSMWPHRNYAPKYLKGIIKKEQAVLMEEALHLLGELDDLEFILNSKPEQRKKRALINVVGRAIKFVFGNPDDRDLDRINSIVESTRAKDIEITHLMADQITFINTSIEASKSNAIAINKIANITNSLVNQMNLLAAKADEFEQSMMEVVSHSSYLMRMMEASMRRLREELNSLKQALSITAIQKLSPYFLPPKKIQEVLQTVLSELPPDLTPITTLKLQDMYLYYSLASVHAASINGSIRLFIDIPLKAPNRFFTMYKALSLPMRLPNSPLSVYVKPDFKYLAISEDKLSHMTLDDPMETFCIGSIVKICPPNLPIYHHSQISCVYAMYSGDDYNAQKHCQRYFLNHTYAIFHRAKHANEWAYSVSEPTNIIEKCPAKINRTSWFGTAQSQYKIKDITISNTGLIKTDTSCSIYNDKFEILAKTHASSNIEFGQPKFHIPKVQEWIHPNEHETIKQINDSTTDLLHKLAVYQPKLNAMPGLSLSELKQNIEKLEKEENKIKFIESDSFFTKMIAYFIFIFIIAAVTYTCVCCCSRWITFRSCLSLCKKKKVLTKIITSVERTVSTPTDPTEPTTSAQQTNDPTFDVSQV